MNSLRPNSVKLAICCLAVSGAISLVPTLVRADFKGFGYQIFGFLIVLFLVFMIYRRKNWARWIYAGCVVVWLVTIVVHLRFLTELSIAGGLLLTVQLALWIAAAFLFFAPSANEWFRIHNKSA